MILQKEVFHPFLLIKDSFLISNLMKTYEYRVIVLIWPYAKRGNYSFFWTGCFNCLDLSENNSEYTTAISIVLIGLYFWFSITFFCGSGRSHLCMRCARTVSILYALNICLLARYWLIDPVFAAWWFVFYAMYEVIQLCAQLISVHCTSILLFTSARVKHLNAEIMR